MTLYSNTLPYSIKAICSNGFVDINEVYRTCCLEAGHSGNCYSYQYPCHISWCYVYTDGEYKRVVLDE